MLAALAFQANGNADALVCMLSTGSDATAVAYVEVDTGARDTTWGVGLHESIVSASLRAIVSAVNNLHR